MRRNFILILFILLSTFSYTLNGDKYGVGANKDYIELPKSTNSITTIRLADDKKTKITKKELKDEIKRRKKYHKTLLSVYNESFDPEYLNLIEKNSSQLSVLRALLKT